MRRGLAYKMAITYQTGPAAWRCRLAFTLTELIVVIALMVILLGVTIPGLNAMRGMNQISAAINTINAAVAAARAQATIDRPNLEETGDPQFAGVVYSGAALLFTPAGELRLIKNDQQQLIADPEKNAYVDLDNRDDIKLPRDVGVVGITRNSSVNPILLTPPFAMRYNRHGNLIAGQNNERLVYYDGDNNGTITVSSDRSDIVGYNPDGWDPNSPTYTIDRWDSAAKKFDLPFEQIETVIGVVVYSKRELRAAGWSHDASGALGNPLNNNARGWLLDPDNNQATDDGHGEVLLFNRLTGTSISRGYTQ